MKLTFYKYQGTGNDFILIDNRTGRFDSKNEQLVSILCDRRFGIGADGLMLLEDHDKYDFTMRYYNSDGKEATMCGNGGRCIAAFAVHHDIVRTPEHFRFMAVDGLHEAKYENGVVSLKMTETGKIDTKSDHIFLDTGSPHYVTFVKDNSAIDIVKEGSKIRYSEEFKPIRGSNVNFVQIIDDKTIKMRTYERGVEDETLSCGTGAVASAISTALKQGHGNLFTVKVPGGELQVKFEMDENNFPHNIWLIGPAEFVFKGKMEV